jgi:hypothetical protein
LKKRDLKPSLPDVFTTHRLVVIRLRLRTRNNPTKIAKRIALPTQAATTWSNDLLCPPEIVASSVSVGPVDAREAKDELATAVAGVRVANGFVVAVAMEKEPLSTLWVVDAGVEVVQVVFPAEVVK